MTKKIGLACAPPRPARLGARQLEQALPELLAKINT